MMCHPFITHPLIGTKQEIVKGKLLYKLPMSNRYIGEHNMMYEVFVQNGKLVYQYLGSCVPEKSVHEKISELCQEMNFTWLRFQCAIEKAKLQA